MPGKASKGRGDGKKFKPGDPRTGRKKGSLNKATRDVRDACRGIVEDPIYREGLIARAQAGELSPPVETMLWHYAYGKPKDRVELTGANGGPLKTQSTSEDEAVDALLSVLGKKTDATEAVPGSEKTEE